MYFLDHTGTNDEPIKKQFVTLSRKCSIRYSHSRIQEKKKEKYSYRPPLNASTRCKTDPPCTL